MREHRQRIVKKSSKIQSELVVSIGTSRADKIHVL